MKIRRVLKWTTRVVLVVVLALFAWVQFAYWTSTNDCGRSIPVGAERMNAIRYCEYGAPDKVLRLEQLEKPVPNDNHRIDEGHRLLTYLVPANTPVTVLTRQGDPANFGATSVTVDELSQLVAGQKPVELFEPLDTGVWIRIHVDTVCSIDQQYIP